MNTKKTVLAIIIPIAAQLKTKTEQRLHWARGDQVICYRDTSAKSKILISEELAIEKQFHPKTALFLSISNEHEKNSTVHYHTRIQ